MATLSMIILSVLMALIVFFLVFIYRRLTLQNRLVATTFADVIQNLQTNVTSLLQDKTQLNSILNNMVEGVLGVDREGKVIAVNPTLARIFGFSAEQVRGVHYLEILRHSELAQLIKSVIRRCIEEKNFEGQIKEIRTFLPEERVFEAHVEPIKKDNQCAGAIMVLHDMTQTRQVEQMRRDFVANVSHELKTPLASIKGYAETLLEGALDDKKNRVEFVASIEKQADRMTRLVNDLLDLSAIESGQRKTQKDSNTLEEIVSDATYVVSPLARKKNIVLTSHVKPELPMVLVDKEQIKQVLVNLLENAVKFTPENGTVDIHATVRMPMLLVSVTDSGVGIPKVDLPRVFERFYRVDKARSQDFGGTGLGLSIVKHIVETHGGSVSVESIEGRGATFHFTLPLTTR